ncbi:hypothetical protein LTR47_000309 [Exophiala xenobiotica]|uniref:Glycoside hydrolase family 3 N-terminal domain-containing protein n=1 Tax=Vermiconidia calcicola TaxID=1690605 RepID=A0AAV9PW41_9PEZI|nr:hypothetical protein LTR41_004089 [Exophiala xenobiotica]KAK5530824.1 hypothetical protein LTR25_008681 [Vermiconidia calcicola]KAK5531219.1 hypothetical protein LTR23_009986 [Chaetothyriales sp. CCFEE 6169]KAK5228365.1 hypothetical protein LTR72_002248 [Exophiala xenobiotica]KAK5238566.1 hypothetical protein LTR47_000309 [Exophiala xenobiotica]
MVTSDVTIEVTDPPWQDLNRVIGQLFMMGWNGTTVTPAIRTLIEDHHIGSILLTAHNLRSAAETNRLIYELQSIAHQAGHPVPLTIALDQENGAVNSLTDDAHIRQFPSAMGVAATGSFRIAFDVARATALEIAAVGVNLILGPVLDVLTNARSQPLGVRTFGDDPQDVSRLGTTYVSGYKSAGIATCGKHFPSYGNLQFLGVGGQEIPVITDTLEQLSSSALSPFRTAIAGGLDAMMVGGCALVGSGAHVMHACLSQQVVTELLKRELEFDGVVVSACLGMESVMRHIGVGGGTAMAINAGCDIVVVCRSFPVQLDAISGLKLAVQNGTLSKDRVYESLAKVLKMKSKCTSWEKALNPMSMDALSDLQLSHSQLSRTAYQRSITLLRDKSHFIPLADSSRDADEILLLTPLLKPPPASAAKQGDVDGPVKAFPEDVFQCSLAVMQGEETFTEFGRLLAHRLGRKLLHASYTAQGVRSVHQNLISRASTVLILAADAHRNHYQSGFTKHVAMLCNSQFCASNERREKPLVVVSVSSPYDFSMERCVGTHICTFDFTRGALESLVDVLVGAQAPSGTLPGVGKRQQLLSKAAQAQHWLVEDWSRDRDEKALDDLIRAVVKATPSQRRSSLAGTTSDSFCLRKEHIEEAHFVVRNSSTQALYGFCSTYFYRDSGTGVVGALFVDPTRRNLSIGNSLHKRAKQALLGQPGVKSIQLGSGFSTVFSGLPADDQGERQRLREWFGKRDWDISNPVLAHRMRLGHLSKWAAPMGMLGAVRDLAVGYDTVSDYGSAADILTYVESHATPGEVELYKMAIAEYKAYPVIRARSLGDGSVVGCAIMCDGRSLLARLLPILQDPNDTAGGFLSPIVSPIGREAVLVLQGLLLYGIRRLKAQGLTTCIVDMVSGESRIQAVDAMGFEVLHSFEGGIRLCAKTVRLFNPFLPLSMRELPADACYVVKVV